MKLGSVNEIKVSILKEGRYHTQTYGLRKSVRQHNGMRNSLQLKVISRNPFLSLDSNSDFVISENAI